MGAAVFSGSLQRGSFGDTALKAAARFWFVVAIIGQLVFAFSVASYYGLSAWRGNIQAWNRVLLSGYISGDTLGNTALAGHLLLASMIMAVGGLQLVPQIRSGFPVFHRWNGRLFVVAAIAQAITGLYITLSGRRVIGDLSQHVGIDLNAVMIIACAVTAWRYALARNFATHRRWALRLFVVAGGVWFFRIGFALSALIFQGPIGFDPKTFQGPFLTFMAFAQTLVPLAVLEIYLRAQDRAGARGRIAAAAGLAVLTIAMGAGLVGTTLTMWLPRIREAYDGRISIAQTLSDTIAARGVDEAARQYRELKAAGGAAYNFDEGELNALGYQLIRANRFKDAIRVLQLNVEAYPQSGNVYDSLGEAYLDDGDTPQAIASYRRSLQLYPHNRNAVKTLQALSAPPQPGM
jgi:hypothetical protein